MANANGICSFVSINGRMVVNANGVCAFVFVDDRMVDDEGSANHIGD